MSSQSLHDNVNKNRKKWHMRIWNRSNFNPIFFFSVHWSKDRPTGPLYHNVKLKVNVSIQMGFPSLPEYHMQLPFFLYPAILWDLSTIKFFQIKCILFSSFLFVFASFICLFTLVRNKLNDAFMEWCVDTCIWINWIKS